MLRYLTAAITVVVVALASMACVQVRNMFADRELLCHQTPDDVCIRVADLGLTRLDVAQEERRLGPIFTILVDPVGCNAEEFGVPVPNATRCWMVEVSNDNGGARVGVFEQPDGSLRVFGD